MDTILKTAVVFCALVFILRIVGRRSVAHMTPFELIIIFLIGGLANQAIVADDRSLTNALLAISTVALLHVLVAALKQYFPKFARITDGTPIVIFDRGTWDRASMKRLRVQEEDIMAASRLQGVQRLEQIKYAIVERDGSIAIIKMD
jgi:uncharacterized membrane protein YcaP (DUF421 family)